jgi:hypothetical protein
VKAACRIGIYVQEPGTLRKKNENSQRSGEQGKGEGVDDNSRFNHEIQKVTQPQLQKRISFAYAAEV